jgi:hypothetical protein
MITDRLRSNTTQILSDSLARGTTPRHAAMDLAQSRVLAAMNARGFRPALDDRLLQPAKRLVSAGQV